MKVDTTENPKFFPEPGQFREWLANNHVEQTALWVGYYKKNSGITSMSWPESVDEALCFGWIDGIRKSIDEKSYKIRFTPRKAKSHWSEVNINRVSELLKVGKMHTSGIRAFELMNERRSRDASYEQTAVVLQKEYLEKIKSEQEAWSFYQKMPPSYQKSCEWWIMSAKKEETRQRRLSILIDSCTENEKIPPLRWSK